MAQAAGITFEKSMKRVRPDLKNHSEFIPFIKEKRLKNSSGKDNSKNLGRTNILPRGYVTLEQFAEETKKIINDYYDTHDIH